MTKEDFERCLNGEINLKTKEECLNWLKFVGAMNPTGEDILKSCIYWLNQFDKIDNNIIDTIQNRKKRKIIKDVLPSWKFFNFESETEYFQCVNTCDFHNNDISINDKGNPACRSLEKAENCIIWLYHQKLKTRIEIERQEQTPILYFKRSGKNRGCNYYYGIEEDLKK